MKAFKNKEPRNYQDLEAIDLDSKNCKSGKFPLKEVKHKSNDPQWYFKDSNILKDVASFSYNRPLGARPGWFNWLTDNAPGSKLSVVPSAGSATVPGIMAIHLGLSVGVAKDAQDPINLSATNVYSFVRYKNSGAVNYDAPDLMLYLVAMDSLYACWNWMKRLYGIASTYSQLNRYMPKGYYAAENVDFDDLLSHLADFRAYLNIKSFEISSFCVPATMTYNVRHSWLFSNIYKDSDTRKAQQYMYVPAYFYQYDETSSPNGGVLSAIPVSSRFRSGSKWTFATLKALLNTMLEAVNYSEDVGIMSGDILKAYGQGGLFMLSTFEPDYKVEPVYSREVLTQFENCIPTFFESTDIASFDIKQDPNTNFIKHQPISTSAYNIGMNGRFINFHWDDPTPEDTIVATRLGTILHNEAPTTGYKFTVVSCGSEIAVGIDIVTYGIEASDYIQKQDDGESALIPIITKFIYANSVGQASADAAISLNLIAKLSVFDWAPIFPITYVVTADAQYNLLGALWDFDNYTKITEENQDSMRDRKSVV